jgi:hypothetical protein
MKAYAEKLSSFESSQVQMAVKGSRQRADAEVEYMKALLPVGTVIRVQLGNSLVDLRVDAYGCSWLNPFEVGGVNVRTGKRRTFHAGCAFSVIKKAGRR